MDLGEALEEVRGLEGQSQASSEEADQALERIRREIINGDTTGDSIKDFVIVTQEVLSEEAEQPYRQLEEMLKGKEGQPIFVARIDEDYKHYRFPGSIFETLMYVGILNSENLGFSLEGLSEDDEDYSFDLTPREPYKKLYGVGEKPHVILPTSKYALKQTNLISRLHTTMNNEWKLENGIIRVDVAELSESSIDAYYFLEVNAVSLPSGLPTEDEIQFSIGDLRTAVVKVGEENIREFFSEQVVHEVTEYDEALRLLR